MLASWMFFMGGGEGSEYSEVPDYDVILIFSQAII
jgi:hypothetical protein